VGEQSEGGAANSASELTMDYIQSLLQQLTCGDDSRAETAVQELAAYGPQVLPYLYELMSSDLVDARWWVVRALAEVKDPASPPLLIKALHDPEMTIRECAALGLRQQPDPAAIPDLIECIQSEDRELARLAVDAFVSIGAEAVLPLIDQFKNGQTRARLAAVQALARIGDTRSIPALCEVFETDSALMEYWANEGLEKMGVGMTFFKT
jgi:HEAT repeat protein